MMAWIGRLGSNTCRQPAEKLALSFVANLSLETSPSAAAAQKFCRTHILQSTRRTFTTTTFYNAQRRYTEKHEWVELDSSNKREATVGISDYAQNSLGEIVFVQLPDVGNEVTKGTECGTVESVKAASDIYSPVTGTVTEKNAKVEEKPGLINKSPAKDGWLYRVELSDASEIDSLMEEQAYNKYLKSME